MGRRNLGQENGLRWPRQVATLAVAALALTSTAASAAESLAQGAFVTLGTAGGPVAYAERSQPANLLVAPTARFLVDAGDGVVERLAALGLQPRAIDAVFISHLHMDHIGGLQGLIGLRWMTATPIPLTIYGPPGTHELIDGIVASMKPSARAGFGFGKFQPPDHSVRVVILDDGSDVTVAGVRVRAVRNTHFAAESEGAVGEPASLTYRFDLPGRSVGYTGDTGESRAIVGLFAGVDLLISEVIDLPRVLEQVRRNDVNASPDYLQKLGQHLADHHLSPQQAGVLAKRVGAKTLVLTHLSVIGPTKANEATLLEGTRKGFDGVIAVAHDLDRF